MPFLPNSMRSPRLAHWWRKFCHTLAHRPRDYAFFWRT